MSVKWLTTRNTNNLQESAHPEPVVAVVVVARVNFVRVEVRVEGVVRPVRVSRTGPQVAPVTLVVEALPPVAGEASPYPRTDFQYCSLYCAQRTKHSEILATLLL